jgi:hypothetical protein
LTHPALIRSKRGDGLLCLGFLLDLQRIVEAIEKPHSVMRRVSSTICASVKCSRSRANVFNPDFPDECGFPCTGGPNLA